MPFRYLRDPLFLVCLATYFAHRVSRTFGYTTPFLSGYLNDVICLPFWLPMMVWALRVAGLRNHDRPPSGLELFIPLVIWSVLFEGLLPTLPWFAGKAIADPLDIVCYAFGGCAADLIWRWWYAPPTRVENPAVG